MAGIWSCPKRIKQRSILLEYRHTLADLFQPPIDDAFAYVEFECHFIYRLLV